MDLKTVTPGTCLYLDPKIYAGGAQSSEWAFHKVEWKRQYEIWEHANKLISVPAPSTQDLEAAIIQLHRAVELRDKLLDSIYNFESIPGKRSANKYAIMADLGIIRPNLKVRLRELRNTLIHDPAGKPTTKEDSEFLADTSWYYLKVTDRIAQAEGDDNHARSPGNHRRELIRCNRIRDH